MTDQGPVDPTPPVPSQPAPPPVAPPASDATAAKPDVGKRFIAYVIDAVIASLLSIIPVLGSLLGAAYILVRDGLEFDFMDGRSVGKKLMKLRPVRDDGGKMDLTTSVMRNWPLALGSLAGLVSFSPFLGILALSLLISLIGGIVGLIEVYLVVTSPDGRRLGDKIAHTHVIEVDA